MDVASTIRRERDRAEAVLDADATRALIRKKLKETAATTGEPVTEAEIDAAIDVYFGSLHAYSDPPRGWRSALAHLYVRRVRITVVVGLVLAFVATMYWLFEFGPFSAQARQERAREQAAAQEARDEARRAAEAEAAEQRAAARQRSADAARASVTALLDGVPVTPAARTQLDAAERALAAALASAGNVAAAAASYRTLAERVAQPFEIRIANPTRDSGMSAFEYIENRSDLVSGYYVIVAARTPSGEVVGWPVRHAEDGQITETRRWAEQVPKEVFDRVYEDKASDGVLDATLFGVKRAGSLDIETSITGTDGTPIERGRQLTRWRR